MAGDRDEKEIYFSMDILLNFLLLIKNEFRLAQDWSLKMVI